MRNLKKLPMHWIVAALLLVGVGGSMVWRVRAAGLTSSVDPAATERAARIRSEIQDYTPPEANVPDTAPRPTSLQPRATRQPKQAG